MYKEKELIKVGPDSTGEVKYGKANHTPMRNWNDFTLVNHSEIEFESSIYEYLKDGEWIKIGDFTYGCLDNLTWEASN